MGRALRTLLVLSLFSACVLFPTNATGQLKEVRRVLVFYELGLSSPAVALADQQLCAVLENSPYQHLEPGSLVLNRQPTFWETYRRYVLAGILLLLAQTAVIVALFWQWLIRKRAQAALVSALDRLRLAMESGKSVGWEWDLTTGRDFWFGDFRTMFGIAAPTFTGQVWDFFRHVHTEDRERVSQVMAEARQSRAPYSAEFRVVWQDGTTRWVVSRGRFEYGRNGHAKRMLGMAVDITERKLAEQALQKSEEKFAKAFRESPLMITLTWARDHRYIEVNETFEQTIGWRRGEVVGCTPADLGIWVDPEERALFLKGLSDNGNVRNLEISLRTKDGQQRTCLASAELIDIDGESCALSVVADITDLKRAEETVRESEQRFRLVANTAPVMIWMSGPDKLCNYFNQPWLTFTGRSLDAELGNGWADGVHADDLERCLDTYTQAFDRRESFEMEYRLRRHDGEYRWIYDIGVPRFNPDGTFAGYIGSCLDVSERRRAEEALSTVSRRLIEAHEEERTWIARELHDDINQRLAFAAINLDLLKRELPPSAAGSGRRMEEVKEQLKVLGNDIHDLSHRLHSSNLEYLGLASAAGGFCREFSERQGVEIDFHCDVIPKTVPSEISLCLFRILQEALQNSTKHSGSRNFQVSLNYASNQIHLIVRDSGIGFDPGEAMKGSGLGITSMRERLKLVDGELSIDSELAQGTVVHARVPLGPAAKSALAAKA